MYYLSLNGFVQEKYCLKLFYSQFKFFFPFTEFLKHLSSISVHNMNFSKETGNSFFLPKRSNFDWEINIKDKHKHELHLNIYSVIVIHTLIVRNTVPSSSKVTV